MKIGALNLKKQIAPIRQELDMAIKDVIDNTAFILGKATERFEENVTKYCNVKYAIGVSNGTDAISLALLALGVEAGDGVICPAFTYYATAGAVAVIGARPIFADIDPETYCISIKSVEKILQKQKKLKIKAIIPVHLYGQCADMDRIMRLARKYKLKVIEDTAQAFGAEYKNRKAGTIGNCGSVSFYPGKNLGAFGDAGMILTNEKKTAEKLRILRDQGNKDKYYHLVLGRNNRLDGIQAAVLDVKLKYLDGWNRQREELAEYYSRNLSSLGLKVPVVAPDSTHIYHQYVLRGLGLNKDIMNYLQSKGIDSRVFYPVALHLQKCFKYLGYKRGDFPESEKAAKETFTLPIDPAITQDEREYIIQSVKEFMHG